MPPKNFQTSPLLLGLMGFDPEQIFILSTYINSLVVFFSPLSLYEILPSSLQKKQKLIFFSVDLYQLLVVSKTIEEQQSPIKSLSLYHWGKVLKQCGFLK